jgi:hypothetical protein
MIETDFTAITQSRALEKDLQDARSHATGANAKALPAIDSMSARLRSLRITRLNGELSGLLRTIDGVDASPTRQATAAVGTMQQSLDAALSEWNSVKGPALNALNATLKTTGMHAISIPADLSAYRTTLQHGETADKDDNDP